MMAKSKMATFFKIKLGFLLFTLIYIFLLHLNQYLLKLKKKVPIELEKDFSD